MLDILVVEDDEKIRDMCTRFLRASGYRVRQAKDGMEAVSAAGQQRFDIILLDVKMPKLDGISAFQEIRKTASTPVIMITGYQVNETLEQAMQHGGVECLRKPFTFAELTAMIKRMTSQEDSRNGC